MEVNYKTHGEEKQFRAGQCDCNQMMADISKHAQNVCSCSPGIGSPAQTHACQTIVGPTEYRPRTL